MKKLKTRQAGLGPGNLEQYLIEEGNWTPIIYGDEVYSDATYWSNGHYQRIGNLIYVSMSMYMSNNGTTVGGLGFGGLPYPIATDYVDLGPPGPVGDVTYKEFNAVIGWHNFPLPTGNLSHMFGTFYGLGTSADQDNLIWIGYGDGTYGNQYIDIQTLPNDAYITLTGSYWGVV